MNEQAPAFGDVAFDVSLHAARHHLVMLTCAVGTARYLESCLAAAHLRLALVEADHLAGASARARRLVESVRSIAGPMLALAPMVSRAQIRQLRTSDPHVDLCAWQLAELQWRRDVLQVHFRDIRHLARYFASTFEDHIHAVLHAHCWDLRHVAPYLASSLRVLNTSIH